LIDLLWLICSSRRPRRADGSPTRSSWASPTCEFVGEPDLRVAGAAAREGRMVVAVDRGFGDVRLYPPGSRPAIWQCARVLRQSVIFMLLAIFPVEPEIEEVSRFRWSAG
jgi:hypothetical protein